MNTRRYEIPAWLTALACVLISCGVGAPSRPQNVPPNAVWVGGQDGGVWVSCVVDVERNVNPCQVYGDVTGALIISDDYVLEREARAAAREELSFEFADGIVIRLADGRKLIQASEGQIP